MTSDLANTLTLSSHRASVSSHVFGLLRAYRQAALFDQHFNTGSSDSNIDLLSSSLAHLQIFTVRALETFFRDCFILLCVRDPDFLAASADATRGKLDFASVHKMIKGLSSFEEQLAAQRNFQNLDVVNDAFRPLLGKSLFDALDLKPWHLFVAGGPPRATNFNLPDRSPKWRKNLFDLFETRHQLIHNAHYPLPVTRKGVIEQSESALFIGQLMGILLSNSIGVGVITIEVPLKVVVKYAAAMKTKTREELEVAAALIDKHSAFDGKFGGIGPASASQ